MKKIASSTFNIILESPRTTRIACLVPVSRIASDLVTSRPVYTLPCGNNISTIYYIPWFVIWNLVENLTTQLNIFSTYCHLILTIKRFSTQGFCLLIIDSLFLVKPFMYKCAFIFSCFYIYFPVSRFSFLLCMNGYARKRECSCGFTILI